MSEQERNQEKVDRRHRDLNERMRAISMQWDAVLNEWNRRFDEDFLRKLYDGMASKNVVSSGMSEQERRCGTCRWWGEPTVGLHAKCKHPKCCDYDGELQDGTGDAEYGSIYTGPEFGCIHYEMRGVSVEVKLFPTQEEVDQERREADERMRAVGMRYAEERNKRIDEAF